MNEKETTEVTVVESTSGSFAESLKRNNVKIRSDRADAIIEDAQITFKRKVEDIAIEIKKMKRQRENMLDLSPNNVFSLIVADKFDSTEFVKKDLELGISIREAEIALDIAQKRYKLLFGGE